MMVDVIVAPTLVVHAVMVIVVNVWTADHCAGYPADDGAWRACNDSTARRTNDGAGYGAG